MGLLEEGLARLGLPADPSRLRRLETYLAELALWNRRLGLVKAEGDALIVRHLLDSLAGLAVIRRLPHATVADVGSGAGFPGIPLALFLDEARFTLIERSARSASFLRSAVLLCDLTERVEVEEAELARIERRFQLVTFRALSALPAMIEPLLRATERGGSIVAYKGKRAAAEEELAALAKGPFAARFREIRLERLQVPFLEEERQLVILEV